MTPSTLRLLGIAGAIVALAGLTWIGLGYRRDRGPLVERIDKIRGYVADARAEQRRHDVVLEDLQALAEHTLGGDRETVDHRLRSHLNRLGEAIGLSGLSVNTSRYAARSSPARAAFTARAERQVRDEVDFVEVEATVRSDRRHFGHRPAGGDRRRRALSL